MINENRGGQLHQITLDQFTLLKIYYQLLDTIEEGFEYVLQSFEHIEMNDTERVFDDIVQAFYKIDSTFPDMIKTFKENGLTIASCEHLLAELDTLYILQTQLEFEAFIKNRLAPMFFAWKNLMYEQIQPLVIH